MPDLTGLGSVADLIKTGLDKIWPDKTEAERAQAAMVLTALQGQLDTNKVEAANPSLFVAGWRPNIGWICGIALGCNYILGPLLEWGSTAFGHPVKFPHLDIESLYGLLMGMLGLGGMRSFEKVKGVDAGH